MMLIKNLKLCLSSHLLDSSSTYLRWFWINHNSFDQPTYLRTKTTKPHFLTNLFFLALSICLFVFTSVCVCVSAVFFLFFHEEKFRRRGDYPIPGRGHIFCCFYLFRRSYFFIFRCPTLSYQVTVLHPKLKLT